MMFCSGLQSLLPKCNSEFIVIMVTVAALDLTCMDVDTVKVGRYILLRMNIHKLNVHACTISDKSCT